MTFAVWPRGCLIAAFLLAGSLAACQTTSSQSTTPEPASTQEPAKPVAAETQQNADPEIPADQQQAQGPIQQAAVAPAAKPETVSVEQTSAVSAQSELVFLDFAGFDEDLSREMAADKSMIAVDVPAAFSLNNVPDRLDRWFSRVKESGGAVQAREKVAADERQTRGIVGVLLEIAVSAAKAHEAQEMLKPAEDYSVLVEYDKQTGKADRVLFYRR